MMAVNISPQEWSVLSKLFDDALDLDPPIDKAGSILFRRNTPRFAKSSRFLRPTRSRDRRLLAHDAEFSTAAFETSDLSLKTGARIGPYLLERTGPRRHGALACASHRWRIEAQRRLRTCPIPDSSLLKSRSAFSGARYSRGTRASNIARLYDAGATDAGQPYLALEYVEGLPITEYCDQRRLGIRIGLRLQCKFSKQCATRIAGCRSRDSSLQHSRHGGSQVRLLDFGIASSCRQLAARRGAHRSRSARPDARLRRAEHIAGGAITTATDVYRQAWC